MPVFASLNYKVIFMKNYCIILSEIYSLQLVINYSLKLIKKIYTNLTFIIFVMQNHIPDKNDTHANKTNRTTYAEIQPIIFPSIF